MKKMKKALLITESSVYRNEKGEFVVRGGGEMCFHNIALSLLKMGIEPVVFAISEFDEQVREEVVDGVLYKRVNVKSRSSLKILSYLRDAIKESRGYDFIFVNQFTPHLILPWLDGMKVAVVHDVYQMDGMRFWIRQYGFFRGVLGYFVEKMQLWFDSKYADKIMTVSDFSREKIEVFVGERAAGKIYKNPFPINVNDFYANLEKKNFMLFVGRFVDYKNPEDVLYALKKVKRVFPDFKAVFVASRIEEKVLMRFLDKRDELGIDEKDVVIREKCSGDEVKKLFAEAKLFVQPSYIEGQGIVVLEALASRTPVVAYDLPAYRGMLVNGENCLLVERKATDSFAEACVTVLRNHERFYAKCHQYLGEFSGENFQDVMEQICSNASEVF